MKETLPYLINLPPFMQRGVDLDNFNILQKVFFVLKGKLIGLIINKTEGSLFCFLINIFYSKDGKIYFENKRYYKVTKNNEKIYYPNKRILRSVKSYDNNLNRLFESYCLDILDFDSKNLVIDCGANVGELSLALNKKNIDHEYYAFEADQETFDCLNINCKNTAASLLNVGLSNEKGTKKFYLDNYGGNSSLTFFGDEDFIEVNSERLDSYKFEKNIKLLKIDAEGHEPEVLIGAKEILNKIEYISIDFGAERGTEEAMTIVPVNELLYNSNFQLIAFSKFRFIGLYKNRNFS
tara:strand:+ start:2461 stop:3342 length:882 start_codon:yes stop_codon:yes gene_type:complete